MGESLGCIKKSLSHFCTDNSGQATVEYILLLSFIIVGASQLARGVMRVLDRGILHLGSELEKDLKTGRAPLSVWKN